MVGSRFAKRLRGSADFILPRTNLIPKQSIIALGNQIHISAIEQGMSRFETNKGSRSNSRAPRETG
jgi:hypothetical protein